MKTKNFLDCCPKPELEDILTIVDRTHESEILQKCVSCSKWWFYQFDEYVTFDARGDEITQSYISLSEEDARVLMFTKAVPDPWILAASSGFVIDKSGVRKLEVQSPTGLE